MTVDSGRCPQLSTTNYQLPVHVNLPVRTEPDGDGACVGEIGEDDLLPDVSVTRWPFSNQTQLQSLLHKTSLYQDEPVTGELQRPLIAGEYLWSDPETYGCDYLDLLVGHHEDNGYTTDGIPETDDILWMIRNEARQAATEIEILAQEKSE